MDAPLIVLDDAANTTDVCVRSEREWPESARHSAGRLSLQKSQGSGRTSSTSTTTCSTRFTSQPARTSPLVAGATRTQFAFQTKFKNRKTILQSFLGVIENVDDDNQNLTQCYTVTKVDHLTGVIHEAWRGRRSTQQPGQRHPVL